MKCIYAWLHNHVLEDTETFYNVARLDVVDYNKSPFNTQVLFLTRASESSLTSPKQ